MAMYTDGFIWHNNLFRFNNTTFCISTVMMKFTRAAFQ